jgi:hypothetical protein
MALLAGVGMMTCMLLLRAQRQFRKSAPRGSHSSPARPAEKCNPLTAAQTARASKMELQGWQVQMHETARELTAQLDSKISMLQVLLHEAEEQASRLELALNRAQNALAEERRMPAHQTSQAASLSLAGPHVPARTARSGQRPHAEIFALADAGHSSRAIAERLNTPIGEIELILGLRRELQPPAGA